LRFKSILDKIHAKPELLRGTEVLGWYNVLAVETEWRACYTFRESVYREFRRALMRTDEYKAFRQEALDAAGGICARCRGQFDRLEVHHKKTWYSFPGLRMDPRNVEALCKTCHKSEPSSRKWLRKRGKAKCRKESSESGPPRRSEADGRVQEGRQNL
jgi:5-methylcytosine-specific restriction endonuclease McrA